ncbi:Zinc finger A20 and AN1 domain-containing stress-associated protein 2 [Forsythia ovata]|uniref:Zinc finger A20 and AN1 domain-containing stress-associated protein 2 n=1 Tax=Forsythia ovata TaxID=205694 RepID=A0ABD1R4X5_9LAMI
MESSKETGCQAPEGPILCINNCGFFGTAATMNMCSKCHKDTILKQQHTKLAASSVENFVNGGSGSNGKKPAVTEAMDVQAEAVELKAASKHTSFDLFSGQSSEVKMKDGPNRCTTCHKRVGLTGFNCRCGNLFCSVHRYSDKHDCSFDYRMAAQDVIAKANPVVKSEKLDKI